MDSLEQVNGIIDPQRDKSGFNKTPARNHAVMTSEHQLHFEFEERDPENPRTWPINKRLFCSTGPIISAFVV
jgi:hypothetical protein